MEIDLHKAYFILKYVILPLLMQVLIPLLFSAKLGTLDKTK